jgi:trigger factor
MKRGSRVKAKVSEPESWKRVIEIELPHEDLDKVFNEKLNGVKKDLKLPGFRPGKVPFPLIKQRFGESIRAEAVDDLVQKAFKQACTEQNIMPISRGTVNDLKMEEGKPITFIVEAEVDPAIEIKGYDKLKVKASPKKIKDDDVEEAMKSLQDRFAEFRDAERPSKKGDYVRLEYQKVVIDGKERSDVKNPTYPVELGAEHRIKDFDKGLIGHAAGDVVEVAVKFPKDYAEKDAAGKSGEFTIKITAVQEKVVPPIDSFLKKLGDFENEEALRVHVRSRLEGDEQQRAKNEAYSQAVEALIEQNFFQVPPARIEHFIDYVLEEAARERRQGEAVPTREEVDKKYHEVAIRTIKRQRIIDYIATKEKIAATQEEVDAEIKRLAEQYNQPFDALKQTLRQNGTTMRIREDLREQKTLDFLIGERTVAAEK